MDGYLDFVSVAVPPDRKTKVWEVRSNKDGSILGRVDWHGPWRRYVFRPAPGTLFDQACLNCITIFIGNEMMSRFLGKRSMKISG